MNTNKPPREQPWRIGSFTKNFSWGPANDGFRRLYRALNIGFRDELLPVPRRLFWDRLEKAGFIPHIPSNFFVFNGIIHGESYIFPDELIFRSLSSPHDAGFDRLAFFTLLLSEVGKWKGSRPGQSQPSEWARYFFLERLSGQAHWAPAQYDADQIQDFLDTDNRFEGGAGTRKLSTNLAYVFSLARLDAPANREELSSSLSEWIFLALDRYYMLRKPDDLSIEWATNTLAENDIASLTGPLEPIFIEQEDLVARLYIETKGTNRLSHGAADTVIGVLSRQPLLYKILPEIAGEWLKKRLFVEIVSKDKLGMLATFDAEAFYNEAFAKLHNSIPKPSLTGDQLLALVRPQDDDH